MGEHPFHFSAEWPGGRNGVGWIRCGQIEAAASISTGMGGPGVGTNPDEMLLGAAATCYLMTLAAMIERAGLPVARLALESEMIVTCEGGTCRCSRITHRPHATLAVEADPAASAMLERLVASADHHCMVSNALRGNVAIRIAPCID